MDIKCPLDLAVRSSPPFQLANNFTEVSYTVRFYRLVVLILKFVTTCTSEAYDYEKGLQNLAVHIITTAQAAN